MTAARPHLDHATYRNAEDARVRASDASGVTFPTTRQALQWHYEARERMQAAKGMHPRTERAPDGSQVYMQVDGGRGSNLDEVLATTATIAKIIGACGREHRRGMDMLARLALGDTQVTVAKAFQVSQQVVSIESGKAQAFLTGALRQAGVVR